MNEKQIIKEILDMRDWTHEQLAREAGYKSKSNITGLLNNNKNGVRMDNVVRMVEALGCEVVIRDKMGSKKEWRVEIE